MASSGSPERGGELSELDAAVARLQTRLHGRAPPISINYPPQNSTPSPTDYRSEYSPQHLVTNSWTGHLQSESTGSQYDHDPRSQSPYVHHDSQNTTPPQPYYAGETANPFIDRTQYPPRSSYTYNASSNSTHPNHTQPSSASPSDYDPEHYAPDTTPGKYSRPGNLFPRSRSATPGASPIFSQRGPSTGPPGLTRRVVSSGKENSPTRPQTQSRATSHSYPHDSHDDGFDETEKLRPLSMEGVGVGATPVVDSETTHFGLPPKRQRRRRHSIKKLVPLTQ